MTSPCCAASISSSSVGSGSRTSSTSRNAYESNGNFGFDGRYSANGPGGGSGGGDANLDFLMGTMSTFEQSKQQQNALRAPIPSLYFQDTYHATSRLTLVGGIRWSPEFLPVDVFNRGTTFEMAAFLANKTSSVYPNAPAGTFFYGDPGVSRQFTKNSPWQFSPNVGFSWDPVGDGKTVSAAGASLNYDMVNFFTGQRNQQNPPFATAIGSADLVLRSYQLLQPVVGRFHYHQPLPAAGDSDSRRRAVLSAVPVHRADQAVPSVLYRTVDGQRSASVWPGLAAPGPVHRQPHRPCAHGNSA